MVAGGPGGLYELNPESPAGGPGMLHHHPYPFPDMRGHPGPPDFAVPIGGRVSPPGPMRIGGESNNVPQFNYPGQEWSAEYPPCGPMGGYFPGMPMTLRYVCCMMYLLFQNRIVKLTYN